MNKSRIKVKEDNKGGVDITCKLCGKPIVQSNDFGMYCEDKCGEEVDKEAYKKIKDLFGGIFNI